MANKKTKRIVSPKFESLELESVGTGIYDLDYFSGQNATIYIGDVFVDEITQIQYQFSQSKTPVFGYASQFFDAISHGTRIVQGTFTINFKESGYLWLVLQRYKKLNAFVSETTNPLSLLNDPISRIDNADLSEIRRDRPSKILGGDNNPFVRINNFDQISRATIERLISGEASKTERFSFYNDLAGYATVNNKNARDRKFEDIVEAFEDEVWQDKVQDIDELARMADDNDFDDFDIFIVYGDYTNPGSNHTVRRIRKVHITGLSQIIDSTGEPIQETYSFLARSII